ARSGGVPLATDRPDHHLAGQPGERDLEQDLLAGLVAVGGEHLQRVLLANCRGEVFGGCVVRAYFSQGNVRPSECAQATTPRAVVRSFRRIWITFVGARLARGNARAWRRSTLQGSRGYNRRVSTKVWLSNHGEPRDPQDATISVFDRGFLYGDSVYETLRTSGGRIVELGAHLDRLRRSAEGIAFELPVSDAEITDAVEQTLAAAANDDSRIRVVVTRGTGPIDLDTRVAESPLVVVIVSPLVLPTAEQYQKGIPAVLVREREGSIRPGLKTGNYLGNILALRRAHELGAEDAIMCNADGAVAEGATSNLFMVVAGSVHTPSIAT